MRGQPKKLRIYDWTVIMWGHQKTLFYENKTIEELWIGKNHYYRIVFLCFLKNKKLYKKKCSFIYKILHLRVIWGNLKCLQGRDLCSNWRISPSEHLNHQCVFLTYLVDIFVIAFKSLLCFFLTLVCCFSPVLVIMWVTR